MTPDQSNPADLTQLNYAYEQPNIKAIYKVLAEDFMVEEQIAYQLSGDGEHLWCWVEKKGENTDWVLQQLAKWAGVSPSKIGVAGQKDRHAITRQWFSIQLPGLVDPNVDDFIVNNVTILKMTRHQRKLQTGGLSGNRFTLVIRDICGGEDLIEDLQARLNAIKTQGVPNYFGEQRFGIHGRNIKQGIKFLAGGLPKAKRNQKSMYLSAVRSWMFNHLLSERLALHNWNKLITGDVLQLEGSNKWFVEDRTLDLPDRVAQLDLHPTGALYGKGELPTESAALAIEREVACLYQDWITGLVDYGVNQDRRALRVLPIDLEWQWLISSSDEVDVLNDAFNKIDHEQTWQDRPVLKLSFSLRAGSYATMVLREVLVGREYQGILKSLNHSTE